MKMRPAAALTVLVGFAFVSPAKADPAQARNADVQYRVVGEQAAVQVCEAIVDDDARRLQTYLRNEERRALSNPVHRWKPARSSFACTNKVQVL